MAKIMGPKIGGSIFDEFMPRCRAEVTRTGAQVAADRLNPLRRLTATRSLTINEVTRGTRGVRRESANVISGSLVKSVPAD